jgi:hypothetical protein
MGCVVGASGGSGGNPAPGTGTGSDPGTGSNPSPDPWVQKLAARKVNYPAALRTAALRLTGALPTVDQIEQLTSAADPKATYQQLITAMASDPRFQTQMLAFWRNTFKMGGSAALDAAPVFATQLTVANGSSDQLFKAATGTCPTISTAGAITAADCTNGAPITAGVLTNPGVMQQFFSNMAFRRTRWVQEVFDCTAFPAEVGAPTMVGPNNAAYTAPWPFASIAGADNGGKVDFHDTSGVVCASCHATMNHIAPLFANFDAMGVYQTAIAVKLPTTGNPAASRTDWLPGTEPTGWRFGNTVTDLGALGTAMAADPSVTGCIVARMWNFALGKGDIVQTLSTVPPDVIASQVTAFDASGHKLRDLILAILSSDDFTEF